MSDKLMSFSSAEKKRKKKAEEGLVSFSEAGNLFANDQKNNNFHGDQHYVDAIARKESGTSVPAPISMPSQEEQTQNALLKAAAKVASNDAARKGAMAGALGTAALVNPMSMLPVAGMAAKTKAASYVNDSINKKANKGISEEEYNKQVEERIKSYDAPLAMKKEENTDATLPDIKIGKKEDVKQGSVFNEAIGNASDSVTAPDFNSMIEAQTESKKAADAKQLENNNEKISDLMSAYIDAKEEYENQKKEASEGAVGTLTYDDKKEQEAKATMDEIKAKFDMAGYSKKEFEQIEDDLTRVKNAKREEENKQVQQQMVNDGNHSAANTLRTFSGVFGGIPAAAYDISQAMQGKRIDPNSPYRSLQNTVENIDEAEHANITDAVTEKVGKENSWQSAAANFGYDVAMAGETSAVSAAIGATATSAIGAEGKAAKAINNLITLPMFGTSAFDSTVKEGYERGLNDQQIYTLATAAGTAEMLTEMVSLDYAWDVAKRQGKAATRSALMNMLVENGIEGSEEVASDLINELADRLVAGDQSKYNENIAFYQSADGGSHSLEEAKTLATKDFFTQVGLDFVAGTLSGLPRSVGANVVSSASQAVDDTRLGDYASKNEGTENRISDNRAAYLSDKAHTNALSAIEKVSGLNEKSNVFEKHSAGKAMRQAMMDAAEANQASQIPSEYRTAKTTEAQTVEAIRKATTPHELAVALESAIRETSAIKEASVLKEKQLKAHNFTDDEIKNALTVESMYEKSLSGETFTEEQINTLPEAERERATEAVKTGSNRYIIQNDRNAILDTKTEKAASVDFSEGIKKEGNQYLITDTDGQTHALNEIEYSRASVLADAISYVKKTTSPEIGTAIFEFVAANQDATVVDLKNGIKNIYQAARTGISFEAFKKNHSGISLKNVDTLYNAIASNTDTKDSSKKLTTAKKSSGKLLIDKSSEKETRAALKNMSKIQKNFMLMMAKRLGVDFELFNDTDNKTRGSYDPENGKIRINLAYEKKIYTIALHEGIGEFMQAYNSDGYNQVATKVIEYFYAQNSTLLSAEVDFYLNAYRSDGQVSKNERDAANEFVNDTLAKIFSTDENIEKFIMWLKANDPDFKKTSNVFVRYFEAIKAWLKDVLKHNVLDESDKLDITKDIDFCDKIAAEFLKEADKAIKNRDASVSDDFNAIESAIRQSIEIDQSVLQDNYIRPDLEQAIEDMLVGKNTDENLYIGSTPTFLQKLLNIDDYPMYMLKNKVIANGTSKTKARELNIGDLSKNHHILTSKIMAKIPKALNDPMIVMSARVKTDKKTGRKKYENRIIALLNLKNEQGEFIAVTFDGYGKVKKGQRPNQIVIVSNFVPTTYGKEKYGVENLIRDAYNEHRIIYVNKKSQRTIIESRIPYPTTLYVSDFSQSLNQFRQKVNTFKPDDLDKVYEGYVKYGDKISALRMENKAATETNDIKHYVDQVAKKNSGRKSLDVDSEGNKLSDDQKKYFKDSKIRDDKGNLLVVYHGTPYGGFTTFKNGLSYFTANKEYAERYKNPSASSVRGSYEEATNKMIYELYLNITHPFDLSVPEDRDLFINEYVNKWSVSSYDQKRIDETIKRGISWEEAENLQEFFEENEYDYDGLILNEGADGGYGDDVIQRGLSFVTFSPNQEKDVSNIHPTDNPDIRKSLSVDSEGRELTTDQKKFFKNSKVVDDNGNLLVLYHGSDSNFFTFDTNKIGKNFGGFSQLGKGFYFTDSKKAAKSFSEEAKNWSGKKLTNKFGNKVYKVYLNIENPYYIGKNDSEYVKDYFESNYNTEALIAAGYDGIIYTSRLKDEPNQYVVFDANQIKLTSNEYPTDNPDIRKSLDVDSEGRELSADQKEFFKNSKAVDDNGKLLRLYHGTRKGIFTVFDPEKSDDKISFFLTSDKDVAKSYSGSEWYVGIRNSYSLEEALEFVRDILMHDDVDIEKRDGKYVVLWDGQSVEAEGSSLDELINNLLEKYPLPNKINMELYANVENPYIIDCNGDNWNNIIIPSDFRKECRDLYSKTMDQLIAFDKREFSGDMLSHDERIKYRELEHQKNTLLMLADSQSEVGKTREFSYAAKLLGYDSVIFKNVVDMGGRTSKSKQSTVVVAFESNQIKSVHNEHPTDDPDIRKSLSVDSEGRELTVDQIEYFKDSKVVDDNGNLKIVYHGTESDFTVFDKSKIGQNFIQSLEGGFFFTDNKRSASSYGSNLMKVYLNLKNPLVLDYRDNDFYYNASEVYDMQRENILEDAEFNENDGIIINHNNGSLYVAFESNQIKDVTNKNPTDNPDIRFSLNVPDESSPYWDTYKQVSTVTRLMDSIKDAAVSAKKFTSKDIDALKFDLVGTYNMSLDVAALKEMYSDIERFDKYMRSNDVSNQVAFDYAMQIADQVREKAHYFAGGADIDNDVVIAMHFVTSYLEKLTKNVTGDTTKKKLENTKKVESSVTEITHQFETYKAKLDSDFKQQVSALEKKYEAAEKRSTGQSTLSIQAQREITKRAEREAKKKLQSLKETEEKAKQRDAITRTCTRLIDWMDHPTNERHVPDFMKSPLTDMIQAIDFMPSSLRKDPAATTKSAEKWQTTMARLNKVIEDIKNVGEANIDSSETERQQKYALSLVMEAENLFNEMSMFIETNSGVVSLTNLSAEEMKKLHKFMSAISSAINKMNSLYKNRNYENIKKLATDSMDEMRSLKPVFNDTKIPAKDVMHNFLNVEMLEPISYFEELGSAASSVMTEFFDGEKTGIEMIKEAEQFFSDLHANMGISEKDTNAWSREIHELEGITLTTSDIMSLYASEKREKLAQEKDPETATYHVAAGGYRGYKHKIGNRIINNNPRTLHNNYGSIIDLLTDQQKEYADRVVEYMSTTLSAHGNKTSQALYGYDKFTGSYYFPIKTDTNRQDTRESNAGTAQASMRNIINASFTKTQLDRSDSALVIHDFFDVVTEHIMGMANYCSYAEAISDALRWFNYAEVVRTHDKDQYGAAERNRWIAVDKSVKMYIENAKGTKGKNYFEQFLRDLNLDNKSQGSEMLTKLIGMYKAQAVAGNLRVVIQQPAAMTRALDVIEHKYLLKGIAKMLKNPKKAVEYATKESYLCYWKSKGFSDTRISQGMKEIITGNATKMQDIVEKTGALAGWADDISWAAMYAACEAKVDASKPSLEKGSEKYKAAVDDIFSDVVNHTQVIDSTLRKTEQNRNKDLLQRTANAFKNEPQKTYNMLHRKLYAYQQAVHRKKGIDKALKALLKTLTVYGYSAIITGIAQSIADAFRDDSDDTWLEKFLTALLPVESAKAIMDAFDKGEFSPQVMQQVYAGMGNILDNANPLTLMPYISEIDSLIKGFESTRMDTAAFVQIGDTIKKLTNDSATVYGKIYSLSKAISMLTGAPFSNVLREFKVINNNFLKDYVPYGKLYTSNSVKDKAIKSGYTKPIDDAFASGDLVNIRTSVSNYVQYKYDEKIKEGVDPIEAKKDANTAVKTYITNTYKDELKNLYFGYLDGKNSIDEVTALKNKMIEAYAAAGADRADLLKTIQGGTNKNGSHHDGWIDEWKKEYR